MNILHAIDGMNPELGGVCQALRLIITSLTRQDVHSEVVSLDEPTAPFLATESFAIHAQGPGYGPWNYSGRLVPWLVENLPRFDAVIIHGLWQYHGYAVRTAMRQLKKNAARTPGKLPKVFVFPQGMLDPYFQRAPERKLKAIRNWAFWKLVEGRVVNDADGVLFTCESERQLARQPFRPYRPQREVVIGMGMEELAPQTPAMRAAFAAACPSLGASPYLLFLSRIHEKKGVDLLIKAYANLLATNQERVASHPAEAVVALPQLVIVGPGLDTPYGQKMQQLAAETPELRAAIHFPGMLAGDAKWGAFYGCEAFILPSHQENFGIAVVEALVCSKPVLISDQINIWREIDVTGGGIVNKDTESGTLDLLTNWQALSRSAQQAVGQRARACYETHFAIGPVTQRIISAVEA